jgi:hypothetical protein
MNGGASSAKTDGPRTLTAVPAVVSYNGQMHVCYTDQSGIIWDAWYDGAGHWDLQQLTGGSPSAKTHGPPAIVPAVVSYNGQMHVCYADNSGIIWDAWYDGAGHWNLQQLTGGGSSAKTDGPRTLTAIVPAVVSYNGQMHVYYPNVLEGLIYDAWYDGGHWHLQQLTGGGSGNTDGPQTAWFPAVVSYRNQMHVCYVEISEQLFIWDVWYDGAGHWHLQQLTGDALPARTDGLSAFTSPAVVSYNGQMHVCYADLAGIIWDAWYDGAGHWNLQQLTGDAPSAKTGGPPVSQLLQRYSPAVVSYNDQMHVYYPDNSGIIWDAWYDGAGHWNLQQLTGDAPSAKTDGPPVAGLGSVSPAVVKYNDQMHVCYTDDSGIIWDAWYDGAGHWHLQQLTAGG